MFTIFTIPKPFKEKISIIQTNAIKSWQYLYPSSEIILFGDEIGISELATEIGVRHIKDIQKNEFGTPLLSDAFKLVQKEAKNDLICYMNTDIILIPNRSPEEIIHIGVEISKNGFLMVGKRINTDINYLIDFLNNSWKENIKNQTLTEGKLQPPDLIDYFIFPKDFVTNMPQFAVGRPGWDNWMIYNARKKGAAVIDATSCFTAVHQNHDYRHIPSGDGKTYEGKEANINRSMMKIHQFLSIEDTNWKLTDLGVERKLNIKRRIRMFWRTLTEPIHIVYNYFFNKKRLS